METTSIAWIRSRGYLKQSESPKSRDLVLVINKYKRKIPTSSLIKNRRDQQYQWPRSSWRKNINAPRYQGGKKLDKIIIGDQLHLLLLKQVSNYIKYINTRRKVISKQGSSTCHAKGKEILGKSEQIHEGHNIKLRRINDKVKGREK